MYCDWSSCLIARNRPMTFGWMSLRASFNNAPFRFVSNASKRFSIVINNASGVLQTHDPFHNLNLLMNDRQYTKRMTVYTYVQSSSTSFPSISRPGVQASFIAAILSCGSLILSKCRNIRTSLGTNRDMFPLATLYSCSIVSFACNQSHSIIRI